MRLITYEMELVNLEIIIFTSLDIDIYLYVASKYQKKLPERCDGLASNETNEQK